jgi:hypothetical protein
MKKETWNKQYYAEKSEVSSNSDITDQDLRNELGDSYERTIRHRIFPRIYQHMFDAYRGGRSRHHHTAIKYIIDQSPTKQRYVLEAGIEFLRAIIMTGMDVKDYTNEGKSAVPHTVDLILREAGLYITSDIDISQYDLDKWLES